MFLLLLIVIVIVISAMTHGDSLTRVNSHLDNVLAQGAEILGNS